MESTYEEIPLLLSGVEFRDGVVVAEHSHRECRQLTIHNKLQ
jgi:hypothetical protein